MPRVPATKGGPEHRALLEALAKFDSQTQFAEALNQWITAQGRPDSECVRQNTISWWVNHSFAVPPDLVMGVEAISGVSRRRLQPRVFALEGAQ